MRDYTFERKKAATSTFSHPPLVSPHTPTLANPVRGFGLPTNNVIQTQTAESAEQQAAQAADERSKLLRALEQPSFGHDISRIAVRRPQAKLTVGAPNDVYEQEADRVAEQVMSMPDAKPSVQREAMPEEEEEIQTKALGDSIQREAMPEEEEEIQTKPLAATITPLVQREAVPEEEEELQTKALGDSIQREAMLEEEEEIQTKRSADTGFQGGSNLENRLSSSQGGGSSLPDEVRSFMEPRFGADFSQVWVHTGSDAVQMNRELGAQAFTHGSDVYFGAGKSAGNNELTAHELTHVVQQTGGVQTKQVSEQTTVQLKCSACEKEEAEVQRLPDLSAVSQPGIQRWSLFGDDEDKEESQSSSSESSSSGGILDWAKDKASGAVDTVTQAGGDAYDWAKDKASGAVDTVTQAGGDAYDWAKDKASGAVDTVTQAGGDVVDWAKDKASGAVDTVTQAGSDVVDWAKETGAEYSNALLEQKKASVLAQINEAKQKLSGQESISISGNQVATLNNHLATLREKSQGLINVSGISAQTDSAVSATGEKAVGASTIESLLTNLQSSISAPLTSSTSSNSGSSDSGSVQGSIQRFLSPEAAAAIAAAGAAAEETAAGGAIIAGVAAPETGGISLVVLGIVALVVAVIVGIIVYASTKPSATAETVEPEMPEGLSREKKEKWKKCQKMYETYKKGTQDEVGSLGSEINSLRSKYQSNKNSLTPQEKKELCAKVHEQISLVERLINERRKYIDAGCDEFDWFKKGTTEEDRRKAHEGEVKNVKAQEGNLRGLLKKLQDDGIC